MTTALYGNQEFKVTILKTGGVTLTGCAANVNSQWQCNAILVPTSSEEVGAECGDYYIFFSDVTGNLAFSELTLGSGDGQPKDLEIDLDSPEEVFVEALNPPDPADVTETPQKFVLHYGNCAFKTGKNIGIQDIGNNKYFISGLNYEIYKEV